MRTTLDIQDDVLQAAKELAQREGSTTGRVLSDLARHGLTCRTGRSKPQAHSRGGVPLLRSRGEIITLNNVSRITEQEGRARQS